MSRDGLAYLKGGTSPLHSARRLGVTDRQLNKAVATRSAVRHDYICSRTTLDVETLRLDLGRPVAKHLDQTTLRLEIGVK